MTNRGNSRQIFVSNRSTIHALVVQPLLLLPFTFSTFKKEKRITKFLVCFLLSISNLEIIILSLRN